MSRKGQTTTTSYIEWNDFISLITRLEKDEDYKFCLLITIGVYTGLRISDILQLRYSDFMKGDIMIITEIKTRKTGKHRSIKITKDLRDIFERVMAKQKIENINQFIFLNKFRTKPIDRSYVNVRLKNIFANYRIKAGGNISSHTFRKTFGRKVMEINNYSGESLIKLMDLFGHSSLAITKRYLGIRQQEIYDVYDSLSI